MQQAEKSHDLVQSRLNPRWKREENAITFNPQICIISSSFFFVCVCVCVCVRVCVLLYSSGYYHEPRGGGYFFPHT